MTAKPTGTVTFLFTDVEGSTRHWEQHPDAMRIAMAKHDNVVRQSIEADGGTIFTTAGDAFCAAFSSPRDAIDAATQTQASLGAQDWGEVGPLLVRMALHSGNADERDGDYFGPPLNRCARLLSTGYGGQILVSLATAQLARDELPQGVELVDLGPHQLRDLEQPEHVFQVMQDGLTRDFPPLKSLTPVAEAADLLAEGRQAHASQDWQRAYDALAGAEAAIELDAEDLQRMGEAAYWTGRSDEGVSIREKAYGAYVREGKKEEAALIAVALANSYKFRLAESVSKAWLARAKGLLEGAEDTEARGHVLRFESVLAFESEGDSLRGLELADGVIEMGRRLNDRNLEALGLQDKGRFLVAMGQVEEGMILVDEAMVAAVGGELDAETTGRSYCNMLSVCDQAADYQRAGEWSDAAQAWCENHSDSAYPGVCRIFRAELKWLRGSWEEAVADLEKAVDELAGFTPIVGAALYQRGEIDLRSGRLAEAAEHFGAAHEHGFTPLPGLALLRLEEGDADGAEELLRAALDSGLGPLARARMLPAWIDIQLALGRVNEAQDGLDELEHAAEMCGSVAMGAAASQRRAVIAADGLTPTDAVAPAKAAVQGWNELGLPFEASQARIVLAKAQSAIGNDAASRLELTSARSALERLGATDAVGRVDALLAG
ncbi:MAG: adenylate/guanylate cyclase domain-containing protein [Acidimicrobiia bacterium]